MREEHCFEADAPMLSALEGRIDSMRQAEEAMMRRALLASRFDAAPATSVPAQELAAAAAAFEAVTQAGALTAQFYCYNALAAGQTAEDAILSFYEAGSAPHPDGWQPPSDEL